MPTTIPLTDQTNAGQVVYNPSSGYVYALTPCCGATGKGSHTPTGVACRRCYQTVDLVFGDLAVVGDPSFDGDLSYLVFYITSSVGEVEAAKEKIRAAAAA